MEKNIRFKSRTEISEKRINQLRLNWRQTLKEQLECISSLEFQEKVWIENSLPGIWWHWDDATSGYFDDLSMIESKGEPRFGGLDYLVVKGNLSQEEADLLKPFNEAFDAFEKLIPWDPTLEIYKKILKNPEWIKITKMAGKILKKIDFSKLPDKK